MVCKTKYDWFPNVLVLIKYSVTKIEFALDNFEKKKQTNMGIHICTTNWHQINRHALVISN